MIIIMCSLAFFLPAQGERKYLDLLIVSLISRVATVAKMWKCPFFVPFRAALCETKIYVWGEEEEEENVCKNSTTSLTIKKALCSL